MRPHHINYKLIKGLLNLLNDYSRTPFKWPPLIKWFPVPLCALKVMFGLLVNKLVWYILKKIIHLSVGESGGYFLLNIQHYSPPLQ